MIIRFDSKKAEENNTTVEYLYDTIDKICKKRGLINKGLGKYIAPGNIASLFLASDDMEQVEGLIRSAIEWCWWVDGDKLEDKEDILEVIKNMENRGIRVIP